MGKFLVAFAVLPFFLFFMMQHIVDTVDHYKETKISDIIHIYAQKARTTGYFTPSLIANMRTEISNAMYIPESEIEITATTTPKYRLDAFDTREMIKYDVQIPKSRIMAAPKLLGLTDEENSMIWRKKGEVASEVLPN